MGNTEDSIVAVRAGNQAQARALLTVVVLLIVSAYVFLALFGRSSNSTSGPDRVGTYLKCQDIIKRRDTAPYTVSFPSTNSPEIKITAIDPTTFQVEGFMTINSATGKYDLGV